MRTELPEAFLATSDGARANDILRACVHCGFCNATCPTYQLLGDELDGPRGRIYLMKDMFETGEADEVTRTHLDRCLTCRACETTCPSGVRYGELLEIGREHLEAELPRPAAQRLLRRWLLHVVPEGRRFRRWLTMGRAFRWALPARLRKAVPPRPARRNRGRRPAAAPAGKVRRVVLLNGCVQRAATPQVNETLSALLHARGIETMDVAAESCCGSLALHLGAAADARTTMAANVDALTPALAEADAVISTASGCGVTLKDYGRLLADDEARREAAADLARRTLDAAEFLHGLETAWTRSGRWRRVAWQAPCTLQHGQRIGGLVESLLERAGYELVPVAEPHLCCGSAGTYSILQPRLAAELRARKLETLERERPEAIATANVGCQLHLAGAAGVPVVHWLELLG